MRLKTGDKIYCIKEKTGFTLEKEYVVSLSTSFVLRINNDVGEILWLSQIGKYEEDEISLTIDEMNSWTNWFVSEKEWLRNKKLSEIGI
jgi:hypothetical protein